jgi:tripartite-type tricarboxylate transporter receptor subunit TctC
VLAAAMGLLAALALPSFAQAGYPDKPITWIVGFPPGGSVDVMTRLVAHKLEQALGQSVVVENRPGGSGVIALNAAAKAAPDGYTLVTVPGPVLTNLPLPRLGKELTGVAMLGKGPMVLVGTAGPSAPVDLKALIASAKAAPGKYSFASSGNGTSQHLAGELMDQMAGIKMTHVPYKGGNQAVTDVIGGQIPLAMLGIPPVLAHVKSGKLKAYGVTTMKRSPALPDVPTMAEAGLPGFEASQWFVVAVPTGVPADRVQKLNAAIGAILKQPDIVKAFENMGVDPAVESPRQTTDYVAADLKRWRALARKSNLALD